MTRTPSFDDPFEREIRDALAREAADPAPDRLVARIERSRHEVRPMSTRTSRFGRWVGAGTRWALPLAAALAVVVVVAYAGGMILRGPGPEASPFQPGASGTASPAPTDTPAPSTPASPAPESPAPSASQAPSADGPAGGPVPAGFQPVSVTFVSASRGWVLGTATCDGQPCTVILRTTDAGRTWARIPAPATTVPSGGVGADSGVSRLRFATPLDGWAYGPELWQTHDGGATWSMETLPGGAVPAGVMALEASGGSVHAAFVATGFASISIATGSVTGSSLALDPTSVDVGAGPVPQPQVVLHGTSGWLVEVDRAVVAGARLSNGGWQAWTPPCVGLAGPALLAASSASDLVAACDIGVWSTPQGVHLFTSGDGGATFTRQAATVPLAGLSGITAAPGGPVIVVAGGLAGGGAALVATADGGRTWTRVATITGTGSFSELGFTTTDQGVAIASTGGNVSHLVMTRDGGASWASVDFGGG